MVSAGCEEENNIRTNKQGLFLAHLYKMNEGNVR